MCENETRVFSNVLEINNKKIKTQKEKQKRVVTEEKKWNLHEDQLRYDYQWELVREIYENNITHKEHCKLVLQQIHGKINGYRSQDLEKKKFDESFFCDEESIIESMIQCQNVCYYCKGRMVVLYEYVREPRQWTLDRLDNKFGHNKGNVVIACLQCNLRRKTMHHDRYVFTKEIAIIKKTD